jgi:hypothetical protein
MIKFFWLRDYRHLQKHHELFATLASDAYSEGPVHSGLPVSSQVREVAKASCDLRDPFQICQSPFGCSCKIILSPVRACFHDTSMFVLQL